MGKDKVVEFRIPVKIIEEKKPKKDYDSDRWRRAQDMAEAMIDDLEAGNRPPTDITPKAPNKYKHLLERIRDDEI